MLFNEINEESEGEREYKRFIYLQHLRGGALLKTYSSIKNFVEDENGEAEFVNIQLKADDILKPIYNNSKNKDNTRNKSIFNASLLNRFLQNESADKLFKEVDNQLQAKQQANDVRISLEYQVVNGAEPEIQKIIFKTNDYKKVKQQDEQDDVETNKTAQPQTDNQLKIAGKTLDELAKMSKEEFLT